MRTYKIILGIIAFTFVAVAGTLLYMRFLIFAPAQASQTTQKFDISEGQGASTIASNLENQGLIKSAFAFKFYAVWKRNVSSLQAGTFELSPSMSIADILLVLAGNNNNDSRFTIIEGERVSEIAHNLENKNVISYKEFMNAASSESTLKGNYGFLKNLPRSASLEGFIFPDTYTFDQSMTADEIVGEALKNFGDKIGSLQGEIDKSKYNLFQIITMASIVEREAANDADRPKIASVYFNRLAKGMRLQADPTVQYAKGSWDPVTVEDYYQVNSAYNTYLKLGLPPGPICNPGLASIEAALNPAKTDYFYFFHLDNGTTIFSKTKAEHDAQKAKYRLAGLR